MTFFSDTSSAEEMLQDPTKRDFLKKYLDSMVTLVSNELKFRRKIQMSYYSILIQIILRRISRELFQLRIFKLQVC